MNQRHARNLTDEIAREHVTLEFKRNSLLPLLAGNHSRNLVRLEQRLGVRLAQRGNLISVEGPATARERAATVLRALYERLEAGEELSLADVDAEIGFTVPGEKHVAADEGGIRLRTTASKLTRARSAAQAQYIEAMRNHELAFGLGPAGTGKTYTSWCTFM